MSTLFHSRTSPCDASNLTEVTVKATDVFMNTRKHRGDNSYEDIEKLIEKRVKSKKKSSSGFPFEDEGVDKHIEDKMRGSGQGQAPPPPLQDEELKRLKNRITPRLGLLNFS